MDSNPLYGGLIVAELLYTYKFLVELWERVRHINQQQETIFMLGVLGLIDVTMAANLLTMVIIGGYATFTEVSNAIPNVLVPFTGLFEHSDTSKIRSPPQPPSIDIAVAYSQESAAHVE